jgi:hypothetical protein
VITAQLFGGPHDGQVVTVCGPYGPVPNTLDFPQAVPMDRVDVTGGNEWFEHQLISTVRYRLRLGPRCCATWCSWPLSCTCCPRCATKWIAYDLVRS